MEQIHDHVTVSASQHALPQGDAAAVTALQFAASNTGFDVVRFHVDFRESSNIQLRFPQHSQDSNSERSDEKKQSLALEFECEMFPFERRVLVYVLKIPTKRAFVRVQYAVKQVRTPALQEIEHVQQSEEAKMTRRIEHAQEKRSRDQRRFLGPVSLPGAVMKRYCDDINRFFSTTNEDVFVDASFPPCLRSLVGEPSGAGGATGREGAALYALCRWKHLSDVLDTSWTFAVDESKKRQSTPLTHFNSAIPGQDSFLCALAFLFSSQTKSEWVKQVFELQSLAEVDAQALGGAIRVKLCDQGTQWKQIVIDLFQPGFPIGKGLLSVCAASTGEVYAMLLQKAYAKLKGSYAAIGSIPTITILRELTGFPWTNVYTFSESNERDRSEGAAAKAALQCLLCHRLRNRSSKKQGDAKPARSSSNFVVSFGEMDSHCAFPLLASDKQDGVKLHDIGDLVRAALKRPQQPSDASGGSSDDEPLPMSWSEFFELKPDVWVLLRNHDESKRKRVKFSKKKRNTESRARFRFAFSLADMANVAVVSQCQGATIQTLHLSLDAVENDYSLSRLSTTNESDSVIQSAGLIESQVRKVTASLGSGEYILTVDIEITTNAAATKTADAHDSDQVPKLALTSQDAEKNLELLFACIDQDMDGAISLCELETFLQLHEHFELHDKGELSMSERFMHRFGSPASESSVPSSNSSSCGNAAANVLLLDDLRDVYHFLVAEEEPSNTDIKQRYQELIWGDLNVLLNGAHGNEANTSPSCADVQASSIDVDELEELRCCLHSDAPIVNFVLLPSTFL